MAAIGTPKQAENSNRSNLIATGMLVAIVLFGALVRFYALDVESYSSDEIVMVNLTRGEWHKVVESTIWGRPPVLVYLGYAWVRIFGTTETATRALTALIGVTSLLLVFAVARQFFNRRIALIASLLMSVSVFHIYHSQNYRYYSLVVLFALLSYYFYVRMLRGWRPADTLLYVLSSVLLYYTHSYAIFALVGQGLFFLLSWRRYQTHWLRWMTSQLLIFVGLLPSLVLVYLDFSTPVSMGVIAPTAHVENHPIWMPLYIVLGKYWFYDIDLVRWPEVVAALLFGLAAFFWWRRNRGDMDSHRSRNDVVMAEREATDSAPTISERRHELLLAVLWLAAPVLFPFLLQFVLGPVYSPRYTVSALPGLCLVAAVLLVSIRRWLPLYGSLGMVLILVLPSLVRYYDHDVKEQWRDATELVQQNFEPGDALVYVTLPDESHNFVLDVFDYYLIDQDYPSCTVSLQPHIEAPISDQIADCGENPTRLWMLTRVRNGRDATAFSDAFLSSERPPLTLLSEHPFQGSTIYLAESNRATP